MAVSQARHMAAHTLQALRGHMQTRLAGTCWQDLQQDLQVSSWLCAHQYTDRQAALKCKSRRECPAKHPAKEQGAKPCGSAFASASQLPLDARVA